MTLPAACELTADDAYAAALHGYVETLIDGTHAVWLGHEVGSVEVGKRADLIVIDYETASMMPIHNPVSAIVYSALGHEVRDVLVDGVFTLRDSKIAHVDETAVRVWAQHAADELATRSGVDHFKRRPWRSTTA